MNDDEGDDGGGSGFGNGDRDENGDNGIWEDGGDREPGNLQSDSRGGAADVKERVAPT